MLGRPASLSWHRLARLPLGHILAIDSSLWQIYLGHIAVGQAKPDLADGFTNAGKAELITDLEWRDILVKEVADLQDLVGGELRCRVPGPATNAVLSHSLPPPLPGHPQDPHPEAAADTPHSLVRP